MPRTLSAQELEDFRHDLCAVAGDLFATEGYDAVTMKAIAAGLGVSAMTPYRYFESKAAIYREVRAQAFVRFGRRVEAAADTERDPIARLRAISRAYLAFAREEPGAYRIMFELDPPPNAEPSEAERALAGRSWAPLQSTLEAAVERGLVSGDARTLANVCWVQVHGLASLHIAGRLSVDRSIDDLIEPVFDTLLHGILTRP